MTPSRALPYVSFVLDTALSSQHDVSEVGPGAVLVGWQCGFEPMFVAVIGSTFDCEGNRDPVDLDEAEEIAFNFVDERGWFAIGPNPADYVIAWRM